MKELSHFYQLKMERTVHKTKPDVDLAAMFVKMFVTQVYKEPLSSLLQVTK